MSNYNTNTSNVSKTNTTNNTLYNSKKSTIPYNSNSTINKNLTEKNIHKTYINKNNQTNNKSMVVAYLLWFFLFGVGAHRFYTKNTLSAIIILALTIIGFIMLLYFPSASLFYINVGFIILITLTIWFIIDAFLTYKNVKCYNDTIDNQLV